MSQTSLKTPRTLALHPVANEGIQSSRHPIYCLWSRVSLLSEHPPFSWFKVSYLNVGNKAHVLRTAHQLSGAGRPPTTQDHNHGLSILRYFKFQRHPTTSRSTRPNHTVEHIFEELETLRASAWVIVVRTCWGGRYAAYPDVYGAGFP